jgi:hypothetical protein
VFTPQQYRAKATEYAELVKTANSPAEMREFQELERSFTMLADNEQWLSDNHDKTVHRQQALTRCPQTGQSADPEEARIRRKSVLMWPAEKRKLENNR